MKLVQFKEFLVSIAVSPARRRLAAPTESDILREKLVSIVVTNGLDKQLRPL